MSYLHVYGHEFPLSLLYYLNISLLSLLLAHFSFLFLDNKVSFKQAPGHDNANTMYQPGQSPDRHRELERPWEQG